MSIPRYLEIHCLACRGKGQRLQIIDEAILRADCPDCAGTGLRNPNDASSAQPHRFRDDHPTLLLSSVSSDPHEHPRAD